jgi:xanthine/uracil permease
MTRAVFRLICTALLALASAGAAQAQLRTIPAEAKRAHMTFVQGMTVEVNGRRAVLAAGAQIRDANNMIVLPTALPAGVLVKFIPDLQGQIWRIWILSKQEAAQPDAKP